MVARNVARVRGVVAAPFALENPAASFAVAGAEMAGGVPARGRRGGRQRVGARPGEPARRQLDLGLDAVAVVAAIPVERVLKVHLAGGRRVPGGYVDAHDGAVPAATWGSTPRSAGAECRR